MYMTSIVVVATENIVVYVVEERLLDGIPFPNAEARRWDLIYPYCRLSKGLGDIRHVLRANRL